MSSVQKLPPAGKKPYKKPEIQVYGDLRMITQNKGLIGHADPPPHFSASKTF